MPTTTVTVTVTTPAAVPINQFVTDVSDYWGYQATVPDPADPDKTIPNPQNRGQFVKARVAAFLRESYIAARAVKQAEAARDTARRDAEAVTTD